MASIQRTSPMDIAVSGMRAQSRRMRVISTNIANVSTSKGPDGEAYRRKLVELASDPTGQVRIEQIATDTATPFRRVFEPSNPDAAEDGYVEMPNVDLPVELINLTEASRSYQANAAVMKRYIEMVDLTTELLK